MRPPAPTKPAPGLFLRERTEAIPPRENNNSPRCLGRGCGRRRRRRRPTPRPPAPQAPPVPAPADLSRWGLRHEPKSALPVPPQ